MLRHSSRLRNGSTFASFALVMSFLAVLTEISTLPLAGLYLGLIVVCLNTQDFAKSANSRDPKGELSVTRVSQIA